MSVCGIDFGNLCALIAAAGKGGVDMVLNGASMRQTATAMSFQGKQRFFGDAAAALMRSNIKNTIDCMKLLVGRNYDDEDVQLELSKAFFRHCKLPSGGVGIIVEYNDEETVVSAEHVMAMMLTKVKDTVLETNGVPIGDGVLAVPAWFTDSQRRGILHACEIAELNCLKVANEGTLVALSYGIYKSAKKLFSETDPIHCMFVDVGYTGYSVTLADFIQEKLIVRSSVCDRGLGGRDFDDAIIEFLAETFEKQSKIDVRKNAKALRKLQAAAEKAKKTLSPAGVTQANISVECLADDRDLNCILTLDEFESRCANLVARLAAPLQQCLDEAGLQKSDIAEIELVGGSVRVNCIKKALSDFFGLDQSLVNYGLKTTMNSDEAVARGAALQCAMESSRIKVKPFSIIDRVYYPIEVQYTADGGDAPVESKGDDMEEDCVAASSGGLNTIEIYSRGDELPRKPRRLTFRNKTESFVVQTAYAAGAALPPGQDRLIGTHTVNIPDSYKSAPHDVRVTFVMDKHGCVSVSSAQLMEELPPAEEKAEAAEATEGKEDAPPAPPKRRFKKAELKVDTVAFGLTPADIKTYLEKEAHMANADRIIIETADRRNELESYVYGMRDKLDASLADYATNSEKMQFKELIDRTETWLYEDGFDSTKSIYIKKLDELKVLGNPIEKRMWEQQNRQEAVDAMKRQVEICKAFAMDTTEAKAHITLEEKGQVRASAESAEEWLYDMLAKQGDLAFYNDPLLTVDGIGAKRKDLHTATKDIMNKPKPIPKKEDKKEEPAKSEGKDAAEEKGDSKGEEGEASDDKKDDKGADEASGDNMEN
jgi:heat shock 70kDa protein 4